MQWMKTKPSLLMVPAFAVRGSGLQVGLTWSDAPLAAVYSRPYVIALMPNHIEVRSAQHISQQGLAQVPFCFTGACPS